jgi:hypothetical protein
MPAEATRTQGTAERPSVDNGNGLPPLRGSSAESQQKILSEVSHELGNFFHKLYYWAEYLGDREPAKEGDVTAGEMLQGTIKRLQDFLKTVFDYLVPVELNVVRMTADDLLNSLVGKLATRLCSTPLDVDRPEVLGSVGVLVDPARISHALEITVSQIGHQVGDASRIEVAIGTAIGEGRQGIEIRVAIKHPAGDSAPFRSTEASVEWALAEKLFQLHGGNISQHVGGGEERGVGIFLPAAG